MGTKSQFMRALLTKTCQCQESLKTRIGDIKAIEVAEAGSGVALEADSEEEEEGDITMMRNILEKDRVK